MLKVNKRYVNHNHGNYSTVNNMAPVKFISRCGRGGVVSYAAVICGVTQRRCVTTQITAAKYITLYY